MKTEPVGVLPVDKPVGITSFDVVQAVRRRLGVRRVGHAGTLDPFATGLLLVCVGEATKAVPYLMDGDKTYLATLKLGEETDSGDLTGNVVARSETPVARGDLEQAMGAFLGEIEQIPPIFSAIKKDGRRLYDYARKGEAVEVEARRVRIDGLRLVSLAESTAVIEVRCGKGMYVRSLARDLGLAVGSCAHLVALRRLRIGHTDVDGALGLDAWAALDEAEAAARLLSVADALGHLPTIRLDDERAWRLRSGQALEPPEQAAWPREGEARVFDQAGTLIAIGRLADGVLRVARGFTAPDTHELR